MAFKITDACIACGACAGQCPVEAITEGDGIYVNWYEKLISSFETLLLEKQILTPDLGGKNKTSDVGDEICRILKRK